MRPYLALSFFVLFGSFASAVPGSSNLICRSAAQYAGKQKLVVKIARSNSEGTFAPAISIAINGQTYTANTPDIKKQYGETIHDAALGVIVVTANNWDSKGEKNLFAAQIMSVPNTVKAFDDQGKVQKWSLEADDGGECIDGYGKATFRGVFTGRYSKDATADNGDIEIENQILDCVLTYDTGSAC